MGHGDWKGRGRRLLLLDFWLLGCVQRVKVQYTPLNPQNISMISNAHQELNFKHTVEYSHNGILYCNVREEFIITYNGRISEHSVIKQTQAQMSELQNM